MRIRLAVLACLAMSSLHAAELKLGDQEMQIAFDSSEIDMRKDEHHFRGNVRISQGPMFITSDTAMAEGAAQSDHSRWTFQHNVHVRTAEADLRADTAIAQVVNGTISNATVKGSPALFEQRNAVADKQIQGRAGQIDYDFTRGIVRMSNNVWFSYGGNQFEGAVVVYYVADGRVVVNPDGKSQGRVNITVKPRLPETSNNRDGSASLANPESGS